MIQKKIDSLKPYFKGLKVAENYKIVEVNLKKSWEMESTEDIGVQQKELKENPNFNYVMFYSENKTFDDLISHIEKEVINYNLEIEQKESLLKAKVEELKRVFETKSLDELNHLKFTTEEDSLKLSTKSISVGTNGNGTLNNHSDKEVKTEKIS